MSLSAYIDVILKKYNYSRQNILYILRELQEFDGKNQIKEEYVIAISKKIGMGVT